MDFIGDWRSKLKRPSSLVDMLLPGVSAASLTTFDTGSLDGDRAKNGTLVVFSVPAATSGSVFLATAAFTGDRERKGVLTDEEA